MHKTYTSKRKTLILIMATLLMFGINKDGDSKHSTGKSKSNKSIQTTTQIYRDICRVPKEALKTFV